MICIRECTECTGGKDCGPGGSGTTCNAGEFLVTLAGSSSCVICPGGHEIQNIGDMPTICNDGEYSTGGTSMCQKVIIYYIYTCINDYSAQEAAAVTPQDQPLHHVPQVHIPKRETCSAINVKWGRVAQTKVLQEQHAGRIHFPPWV